MKKLLCILLISIHVYSYGQDTITVGVSKFQNTLKPGTHITLFFTVNSSHLSQDNLSDSLIMPQNWQILTKKITILNEAKTQLRYFYTLSSPRTLPWGDYTIQFQILSKGIILATQKARIQIEKVRKIELVTLSQPEYVKEGDTLRVEYLVQNNGNIPEKIKLTTNRGIVEGFKDSVLVEPNGTLKVVVKQTIPYSENNSWLATSDLKAQIENNIIPIYEAVSIPVYATKIKQNDPYLRFPMEIGGGYLHYKLGEKTWSAYQYEANGRGFLDTKGNHFVDFTVRGPNQFNFPALGNYDEYALTYSFKNKNTVTVGDYFLRVNNLMEFGRFGRGVRYEQDNDTTFYSIFYQKARFSPNQKDALGCVFGLKLKGESSLSISYITKNVSFNNQSFNSDLIGGTYRLKKDKLTLETELVAGYALIKMDLGFYNRLQYSWKKWQFSSDLIYAGKNFYGFYNNSRLYVNTASYNITPKLNVGITSNISRINPSLDANAFYISPYSHSNMAFASYQPNGRNLFFINFTKQEREDRQTPSTFHFKEDYGNFSYTLNTDKWNLFFQSRYGYAKNLLTADLAKQKSFSNIIQPTRRILSWLWVGGYFEHQYTAKFSAQNKLENLYFYGGNVRANYKKNLQLSIMYRNNYAPDELFEKRSFVDASLIWDTKYHRLTVTGGQAFFPNIPQSNQNSFFLSVKNVWKLNVPLAKNKKLGQLRGQLSSLSEGINKEGIIVQLGEQKCITDSVGIFHFSKLIPDKYYLTLAKTKNTEGVIATVKMPLEVEVKADSMPFVQIPLVKTGHIIGKINFDKKKEETGISSKGLPIVLVKLYNEKEQFLTQANSKNEFSFKEMKPGAWQITAFIAGKQEQYTIQNAEQTIEIESNTEKNINFTIKAVERKIYISPQSYQLNNKK